MSGGSYNYLWCKDVNRLLGATDDIESMADYLSELGYAEDAAAETRFILMAMDQFREQINQIRDRLEPVWKAVELWCSLDSDEDELKRALSEYRGKSSIKIEICQEDDGYPD